MFTIPSRIPFLLFLLLAIPTLSTTNPTIHIPLTRRGGPFPTFQGLANLTFLVEQLARAEARFNLTHRVIEGNRVVRKARVQGGVGGGEEGVVLMGEPGREGGWFGRLEVGEQSVGVELDLDMLSADWFLRSTTSHIGNGFTEAGSKSFIPSNVRPFPNCKLPLDTFHLPTLNKSVPLSFTHCRPSKSSLNTLLPQGSVLGLAPASSLSQTKTDGLLKQLLEKGVIRESVWSVMLINGEKGVFSIGGTGAEYVEQVDRETKEDLERLGEMERLKKEDARLKASSSAAATKGNATATAGNSEIETPTPEPTATTVIEETDTISPEEQATTDSPTIPRPPSDQDPTAKLKKRDSARAQKRDPPDWRHTWKWSPNLGSDGYWQILLQTLWSSSLPILKNQPVILDLNTPFILAPPQAANLLYASISGSRQLAWPHDMFHAFPCLNPPRIWFEFAGSVFPAMHGGRGGQGGGVPGGRFSLGRVEEGSGYCVGAVVESRMGEEEGAGGNGLRGLWVIGEPFWRGVGAVFDFKEQKVGMRKL